MLVEFVVIFTCIALFAWLYPILRFRIIFLQKHPQNTGRKLPPFVSFPLPFFGHSLQLHPKQEPFILRNHQKFGQVFGFYMQDRPFFCLDISKYHSEVNSSPNVARSELPPVLCPFKSFPTISFPPILRGPYAEQLKIRLTFIQKQLESYLKNEFPDPTKSYTRSSAIFHNLTACYTLAAWCNLEYDQMQINNAIKYLAEYSGAENSWRDVTLVFPRLAFLARLSLKKYGKIVENMIVPLLPHIKKNTEEPSEEQSLLHILKEKSENEKVFNSEVIDNMIIFLPGAMSIGATVKHLFALLVANKQVLSSVEQEQLEVYAQDGNNFTSSRLSKMQYLDAALKETLRLEFTLASFRYVTEDIVLHDGFVLPAGSHFILTGSAINYDETLFPDSHSWIPQRWIDMAESQKGLKFSQRREAFIWGSGKVICPGRTHATLGMKLITSLLLRHFSCQNSGTDQYTFKARKEKAN